MFKVSLARKQPQIPQPVAPAKPTTPRSTKNQLCGIRFPVLSVNYDLYTEFTRDAYSTGI